MSLYNFNCLKPPGINNIASNCYANSILQCLLNQPAFCHYIKSLDHAACKSCLTSGKLFFVK